MNTSWLSAALLFVAVCVASEGRVVAQERDARELKAAWLYRFGQHVTWPEGAVPNAAGTFVIGVLGPNPFDGFLDKLAGKEIRQRKIVVRYFNSTKDFSPCHILLISPVVAEEKVEESTAAKRLAAIQPVMNKNLLIVSDSPGLIASGAMINYAIDVEGRINLEVNRGAVKQAALEIDARLLALPIVKVQP